jgi:molybdopterin-containing oxidoreductase family membrane subunit
MPVFFIVSALVAGIAVIAIATIISYKVKGMEFTHEVRNVLASLGKILALLLTVNLFIITWKMVTTTYSFIPNASEAAAILLTGPFRFSFWGLEILLGSIVPISILVYPKTRRSLAGLLAASSIAIVGLFATRYDQVISGQIVPSLDGAHGFYVPTAVEISILVGLVSLSVFVFTIGQKIFPLSDN